MKRAFLLLCALLVCTVLLCSCFGLEGTGGDGDDVIVTYYAYEGDAMLLREVPVINGRIAFSTLPKREGYRFLGLFDAESGGVMYLDENGVSTVEITASLTLYSQWETEECEIRFDAGEGTLPHDSSVLRLPYGSTVTEFPVPVREPYTFVGWRGENGILYSNGGNVLSDYQKLTAACYPLKESAVTLRAEFVLKNPTVTFFRADDTSKTQRVEVTYGEKIPEDAFPAEDAQGRELIGWTETEGGVTPFDGEVKTDLTLYPIWKEYRDLILYDADGKGTSETLRLYRDTVIDLTSLGDGVRPGFDVEGWYVSDTFAGNPQTTLGFDTPVDALYAKWEKAIYVLSFDAESAGEALSSLTYQYGDSLSLPVPAREGHRFVGWYTDAECKGEAMTAVRTSDYGSYTLYAGFERLTYSVSLDAQGGTLTSSSASVTYAEDYTLEVPTLEKHAFLGWYTDATAGELFADATGAPVQKTYLIPSDITLYARWEIATYTLTFDPDSAGKTIPEITYLPGETVELPTLFRTGARFLGWCTDAACETVPLTRIPETIWGSFTLYACFEEGYFRLTLDAAEGAGAPASVDVRYGKDFTLAVPERDGYVFLGWYTDATAGELYADEEGVPTKNVSLLGRDMTLYARWEALRFTVTYVTDGATEIAPQTYAAGEVLVLPEAPVNGELFFAGWYDEFFETAYGADVRVTSDLVLYARWMISTPISTAEDLRGIAQAPEGTYHLVNDIDLCGEAWDSVPAFRGSFFGCGYRIHSFTLGGAASVGFFESNYGTVSDLTLCDFTVSLQATYDLCAGALCGANYGRIVGCTVANGTLDVQYVPAVDEDYNWGMTYVGGVVGANSYGAIVSTRAEGLTLRFGMAPVFTASENGQINSFVGLFAGRTEGRDTGIERCSAQGTVELVIDGTNVATSQYPIGFYAGGMLGSSDGRVSACTCDVQISLSGDAGTGLFGALIGGFVAATESYAEIDSCSAHGTVTATDGAAAILCTAGFAASNNGEIRDCCADTQQTVSAFVGALPEGIPFAETLISGGFVGYNMGTVEACYCTGTLTDETAENVPVHVGGFVAGVREEGAVSGCFTAVELVRAFGEGTGLFCALVEENATVENAFFDSSLVLKDKDGNVLTPASTAGESVDPRNFVSAAFIFDTLSWNADVWTVDGTALPKLCFEAEES